MQQLTNTCVHWLSMRPLTPLCPLSQDCCACPPLCAAAVMTHPGLIWVSRRMQAYIAQLLHNVIYSTVFAHPPPKSAELLPAKKWQPTMCRQERWIAEACQGARCWLHKVHCFLTAHMHALLHVRAICSVLYFCITYCACCYSTQCAYAYIQPAERRTAHAHGRCL